MLADAQVHVSDIPLSCRGGSASILGSDPCISPVMSYGLVIHDQPSAHSTHDVCTLAAIAGVFPLCVVGLPFECMCVADVNGVHGAFCMVSVLCVVLKVPAGRGNEA